jgi:hypothetical protein
MHSVTHVYVGSEDSIHIRRPKGDVLPTGAMAIGRPGCQFTVFPPNDPDDAMAFLAALVGSVYELVDAIAAHHGIDLAAATAELVSLHAA